MSVQVEKRPKMDGEIGNVAQIKSTLPKRTCDLSSQKFGAIVGLPTFVDKTLFIKAFLEADNSVIATLAPRRFGKSTNMDMVREFLLGNKKLFEDNKLKIYAEERDFFIENCEENPVIYVDFKDAEGKTEDEVLESMKAVIRHAYDSHQYLVKEIGDNWVWSDEELKTMNISVGENWAWSDEKLQTVGISVHEFVKYWKKPENISRREVIVGLKRLSRCLHVYHGKLVYVFVDEYDGPIMKAIMQTNPGDGIVDETINLLNSMMSNFLKGNEHVKKGLINACVQVPEVLSRDTNDIKYYRFLRAPEFAPYFGFTDKEVKELFERDEFVTLKNDEIQKWYNGYKLVHTNEYVIYSSYSILEYLRKSRTMDKPHFDTYWVNSQGITNMKELFAKATIRNLIDDLVNDEEVEINIIQRMSKDEILTLKLLINLQLEPVTADAHLFLQFLAENGYLNVVKYTTSSWHSTICLRVPNEEIKKLLREKCYNAELVERKYQLRSDKIVNYVEALCLLLQQQNRAAFIRVAKAVNQLFAEALIPNNADELHTILFTLLYNFRLYQVQDELRTVQRIKRTKRSPHLGIFVVLGDVGLMIELNFSQNPLPGQAYENILRKGYDVTAFNDYTNVTVKIFLGLGMGRSREVDLCYKVNDSPKYSVSHDDNLWD